MIIGRNRLNKNHFLQNHKGYLSDHHEDYLKHKNKNSDSEKNLIVTENIGNAQNYILGRDEKKKILSKYFVELQLRTFFKILTGFLQNAGRKFLAISIMGSYIFFGVKQVNFDYYPQIIVFAFWFVFISLFCYLLGFKKRRGEGGLIGYRIQKDFEYAGVKIPFGISNDITSWRSYFLYGDMSGITIVTATLLKMGCILAIVIFIPTVVYANVGFELKKSFFLFFPLMISTLLIGGILIKKLPLELRYVNVLLFPFVGTFFVMYAIIYYFFLEDKKGKYRMFKKIPTGNIFSQFYKINKLFATNSFYDVKKL